MGENEPLPLRKDCRGVGKKGEEGLQAGKFGDRLVRREPKPVCGNRAGCYNPDLVEYLRDKIEGVSPLPQRIGCVKSYPVLRVTDLDHPPEDVGVKKHIHVRSV